MQYQCLSNRTRTSSLQCINPDDPASAADDDEAAKFIMLDAARAGCSVPAGSPDGPGRLGGQNTVSVAGWFSS